MIILANKIGISCYLNNKNSIDNGKCLHAQNIYSVLTICVFLIILTFKYEKALIRTSTDFKISYRKQPVDERCRKENPEYIFELHTERMIPSRLLTVPCTRYSARVSREGG